MFAFFDHLAQHPPCYVILAAVHMEKKVPRLSFEKQQAARQDVASILGPAQPLPANLQDLVDWADSLGEAN